MSIVAKPISDADLIIRSITHPRVWPSISDDSSPDREDFVPVISDGIIYLGMYAADEYCGLFMLHPHNSICWEVHTCLLPNAWGRASIFTAECLEWIFENTQCQRLITNIPDGNPLAKRLALASGMQSFGINPKSFLKNGILLNQTMLGISKE